MDIYQLSVSNEHAGFFSFFDKKIKGKLLCEEEYDFLNKKNHREPLLLNWKAPQLVYYRESRKIPKAEFTTTGITRIMTRHVADQMFVNKQSTIELLPIVHNKQEWFILNCLNFTKDYVEDCCIFSSRIRNNEISGIKKIVFFDHVFETKLDPMELFMVDDSNRTQVLLTEKLKNYYDTLDIPGIGFLKKGKVISQAQYVEEKEYTSKMTIEDIWREYPLF